MSGKTTGLATSMPSSFNSFGMSSPSPTGTMGSPSLNLMSGGSVGVPSQNPQGPYSPFQGLGSTGVNAGSPFLFGGGNMFGPTPYNGGGAIMTNNYGNAQGSGAASNSGGNSNGGPVRYNPGVGGGMGVSPFNRFNSLFGGGSVGPVRYNK